MASHKDGLRTRHTSQPVQGAYHAARAPVQDVGVDLRGLDVSMAQQLLHGADVIAGFKQVGGEGVAEGMTAGILVDSGLQHGLFDRPLKE